MQRQWRGSVVLAAVVAVLAIGAILFLGLKSANQTTQTVVSPTQAVFQGTPAPTAANNGKPESMTINGSLDSELQSLDNKIGSLDTYQKNIDNAINDKPIDTGL